MASYLHSQYLQPGGLSDWRTGGWCSRRMSAVRCSIASSPQLSQVKSMRTQKSADMVRIGILGASGYTGAEVIRLLASHPNLYITLLTADRKAGQPIASVFPHLEALDLPNMVSVGDADFVACHMEQHRYHESTVRLGQEIIKALPKELKVVDLSADFRLRNVAEYEQWYSQPHRAPALQEEAVYGLTEAFRDKVRVGRLIANPGCYPTSVQLPLIPLLKAGLIKTRNIIINSKSGVSGAGRAAKEANLYTEVAEGMYSYGLTNHLHVPEIEQGLSEAARAKVEVSFTPDLIPMSRGMQSNINVEMAPGATIEDLREQLRASYENEEFIILLKEGVAPKTQHVRGSNYCVINVFPDRLSGRAIIISVIDNLVKGASGQALQNMNLILGFPETTGLLHPPMFP